MANYFKGKESYFRGLGIKIIENPIGISLYSRIQKMTLKFDIWFLYWYQKVLSMTLNTYKFEPYAIVYYSQPIWSTKRGHFIYLIYVTKCLSHHIVEKHLDTWIKLKLDCGLVLLISW